MDPVLRPANPADLPLVKQTLYLALAWDPEDPIPPFDEVVDHPEIAIYHAGWQRPDDVGIVAEIDGDFVGMAYYRFFVASDGAQGFVDPDTPELAIAVVESQRGSGIGSSLLRALHGAARDRGVERLSLSVAAGNPARRLYAEHGYVPVDTAKDGVMVASM